MMPAQILINQISFHLASGKIVFDQLSMAFSKRKTGLVGKNGVGKSTLLKLILGEIRPSAGSIHVSGNLAYLPQKIAETPFLDIKDVHSNAHPEKSSACIADFRSVSVAGVLGYEEKILALQRISQGSVDENDFSILDDDWSIEERLKKQLALFQLEAIPLDRPLKMLSGGEVTRLLLVKAFFSEADFLILDEPTNHLDRSAREQLYEAIRQWPGGLIIVSHDRRLLNLMEEIIELTSLGAVSYGGNYDEYVEEKSIQQSAKEQKFQDAKKLTQKIKRTVQSSREKHEHKQSYGHELRRSGSIDKLAANSKKGRSERTQSKLLIKEERLTHQAVTQLRSAKEKIEINEEIHVELPATKVPNGKVILEIENLNFSYPSSEHIIIQNFDLKIYGPERLALIGDNGSGKTTLIKLILGELQAQAGKIYLGTHYVKYLDQNASLLKPELSILENFLTLNPDSKEIDAYRSLAKFLFRNVSALKLVRDLSGGETLRALLACVLMSKHPPQLLILDEPTNHLDLSSVKSIESALQNYQGAMIVISHDQAFLKAIKIERFADVIRGRRLGGAGT